MKQNEGQEGARGRFERLLLIGTEGRTLISAEAAFHLEHYRSTIDVVQSEGERAVESILSTASTEGAPRTALARALAMAACFGDQPTRTVAFDALPVVCPGSRELFRFVDACKGLRGWGRGVREAVAHWYVCQPVDQLEAGIMACPRYGEWAHRDFVRLSHPVPTSSRQSGVFRKIVDGGYDAIVVPDASAPTLDSVRTDTTQAFERFSGSLLVGLNTSASMAATSIPSGRHVSCSAASAAIVEGLGASVAGLEVREGGDDSVDVLLTDFDRSTSKSRVVWALAEATADLPADDARTSILARGFEPEFPGLIARFLAS